MARIGLNNFRYGILDDETEKYNGALTLGKAIDCKVSLDLNSAELYADDTLAETDYSVKKATVTITFDEDDDEPFFEEKTHTGVKVFFLIFGLLILAAAIYLVITKYVL